jgi:hypothetical protein
LVPASKPSDSVPASIETSSPPPSPGMLVAQPDATSADVTRTTGAQARYSAPVQGESRSRDRLSRIIHPFAK